MKFKEVTRKNGYSYADIEDIADSESRIAQSARVALDMSLDIDIDLFDYIAMFFVGQDSPFSVFEDVDAGKQNLVKAFRRNGLYHQRRTKAALQVWKNSEFYADNLLDFMTRDTETFAVPQLELLTRVRALWLTERHFMPYTKFKLTDEMWMDAIELGLMIYSQMDYYSDDYTKVLPNAALAIDVVMLFIVLSKISRQELEKGITKMEDETLLSILFKQRATIASLHAERDLMTAIIDDLQGELDAPASKPESAEAEHKSKPEPDSNEQEKLIQRLLHEQAAQYKKELRAKDAEIRQLQRQLKSLQEDMKTPDNETEATVSAGEQTLAELPPDGVVFLGGHTNMVKKLREKFPGWFYFDANALGKSYPANTKCVFAFTGHLSHKMYNKCRSLYPSVPILYVDDVNIDKLCNSMRQQYNAVMQ